MNKDEAKAYVVNKLTLLLNKLSSLSIKPQTKLKILKQVVYPRISFELKAYDFGDTWISNSLDNLVHMHVRRWFELPINSCVEELLTLPKKKCGYGIQSLRAFAKSLRLTTRSGLQHSPHEDIQQLWTES